MNPKITGVGPNTFYNTTSVGISGTSGVVILQKVLIPAGTYTNGDLLIAQALFEKIGSAGTFTYRLWASPNDPTGSGLTGAIQILVRATSSGNLYIDMGGRHLYIKNASGGGSGIELGTEASDPLTGLFSEMRSSVASNLAINWNADVWIFASGQLASTADRLNHLYLKIWEY
jgi:hypothetical protein